jgi:hypothetical protein
VLYLEADALSGSCIQFLDLLNSEQARTAVGAWFGGAGARPAAV